MVDATETLDLRASIGPVGRVTDAFGDGTLERLGLADVRRHAHALRARLFAERRRGLGDHVLAPADDEGVGAVYAGQTAGVITAAHDS